MKLNKLSLDNIGKLAHFEMSPAGRSVTIKGPNGAGKTTILNSIVLGLSQVEGVKLFPKMVKEGEDSGTIRMEFDNGLTVERVVNGDNSTKKLVVKNADGSKLNQGLLNKMFSLISFKLDPVIDYDSLRQSAGLDFTKIETRKKKYYDDRTKSNRDLKSKEAILEGLEEPQADWPTEKLSMDALLKERKEYDAMRDRNRAEADRCSKANEKVKSEYNDLLESLDETDALISSKEAEIERLKKECDELTKEKAMTLDKLASIQDEVKNPVQPEFEKWTGTQDIDAEISQLSDKNELYQKRVEHQNAKAAVEEAEDYWKTLDEQYKGVLKEEAAMIAAADFKIPGLSLDPETKTVLFNDLPFASCSKSEGLLIGLQWLAAQNPKMKFALTVQVEDYLDDDHFAEFHAASEQLGIQIINEQVRSIDPNAIVITGV